MRGINLGAESVAVERPGVTVRRCETDVNSGFNAADGTGVDARLGIAFGAVARR